MRDERIGLWMIVASLGVILVITALLARHQVDLRREQARIQGVSLVRLLSQIPLERLLPGNGQQGPLQVLKYTSHQDFAYAAIVSQQGEPIAEVTAPGAIVPRVSIGAEPASWLGMRTFGATEGSRSVREFFAPVLSADAVVAHVRIGFFDPGYGIVLKHASFLGMLALPIFLLTPLAYLMIRRELRPLALAHSHINALLEGRASPSVRLPAGGLGEFMRSFNRFVSLAEERFEQLQNEHAGLLTSSKITSYHKNRIESVLETLPYGALVLDEIGVVTYANSKLDLLLGVTRSELSGRRPQDWCQNPELLAFLARFHPGSDRLSRAASLDLVPDADRPQRLQVLAHPLVPSAAGVAIPGTLVLIRDVTAESLERMGQAEFVSHIAHELKSPLNVLGMYSETLLGEEGKSEDFRVEACNIIHDEVERLSSLIGTLLSIARIEAGVVSLDRQRVRLEEFLKDILDTMSRSDLCEGLDLTLEVPREFTPIHVDKDLVRVAINNLLTNAIKYNRKGGSVTLSAEEPEEAICIRVRDTGVGISAEDQRRIFDKFFRAGNPDTEAASGHGLGLTLANQIVELHGGRIELSSEPEEGSEFSIILPKNPALLREPAAT